MDIQTIQNDIIASRKIKTGLLLKHTLGLDTFKYVWIKKVFAPFPLYFVYYDSRFPNLYLPMNRLKKLKAFRTYRIQKMYSQGLDNLKMTPAIMLDKYRGNILGKSIIICYDLAGEYYHKDTNNI